MEYKEKLKDLEKAIIKASKKGELGTLELLLEEYSDVYYSKTVGCPDTYDCPVCGTRMQQAGHYRECPRCPYSCRWFYNQSGLGDTAEMLDYYETLPR